METKQCLKCKYSWTPRKGNPKECPACKSRYWQRVITPEGDINGNGSSIKE